jgi:hypothetical protein
VDTTCGVAPVVAEVCHDSRRGGCRRSMEFLSVFILYFSTHCLSSVAVKKAWSFRSSTGDCRFIRHILKIAKSDCELRHVCPSRLALDGFL